MADEVKLEEQWVAEKAAKQAAARRPPPKPPRMILGALIAVLLMAGAGVAIYFIARSPRSGSSAPARVRIEVRSMPAMDIAKDGRHIGRTPLSFVVTTSKTPITLQADWVEQRLYPTGPRRIARTAVKTVVPDHDQTIDFKRTDE